MNLYTTMILESLLREQEFILTERRLVEEAVEKCLSCEQKKKIADLQSVPGVGPVLTRTFVTGYSVLKHFRIRNIWHRLLGLHQ